MGIRATTAEIAELAALAESRGGTVRGGQTPPVEPEPEPAKRKPSWSVVEAVAMFAAHGLPEPVREFRFAPPRRWRFDFCWPSFMVALEVEGGVWSQGRHTRGAGFLADMEKYNAAALAGWRLLRCTPEQVKSGEAAELVVKAIKGGPDDDRKSAKWNERLENGE